MGPNEIETDLKIERTRTGNKDSRPTRVPFLFFFFFLRKKGTAVK